MMKYMQNVLNYDSFPPQFYVFLSRYIYFFKLLAVSILSILLIKKNSNMYLFIRLLALQFHAHIIHTIFSCKDKSSKLFNF
jgi:hypothetical protein